jgi:hypothetical protein
VYLANGVVEPGSASLVVTLDAGEECTWLGGGSDIDPYFGSSRDTGKTGNVMILVR